MMTPSEILDEAGDEMAACPHCSELPSHAYVTCGACKDTGRVPKPKAEQPSADSIDGVTRALYAERSKLLDAEDPGKFTKAERSLLETINRAIDALERNERELKASRSPGLRIEQPASLSHEIAFQLAMGELVEWSAGKVQTTLVMTLLVALAGAVGAGVGSTMDDDALRACFDHGFNSKPRERE